MDDKDGRLAAALQASKQQRRRQDDRDHQIQKKVQSRLMYNRRKLDQDVRRYTNKAHRINSRVIDRIGIKHGFHIAKISLGKIKLPPENA